MSLFRRAFNKPKIYDDVNELIDEGILRPYDILIIWGKRGKGKSAFLGKILSDFMKPVNAAPRLAEATWRCQQLAMADIYLQPPEDHVVYADTFFEDNGYQGKGRRPYQFSGLEFGIPNNTYDGVQPVVPCSVLGLDEVQDLYDSHDGAIPTFVSKGFELSRQLNLFIAMTCQRPIRVVKDIRDLATFVEVVEMQHEYVRGTITSTIWTLNIIYENSQFEKYADSLDPELIDRTIQIRFKGCIFDCYDPNYFMPMFYKGFENSLYLPPEKVERTEFSREGFERFHKNHKIDIPKSFRGKKEDKPKDKNETKEKAEKNTKKSDKKEEKDSE